MDKNKAVRIFCGITAIAAGVLMILASNMMIAKFTPAFGESARINALVIIPFFLIAIAVLSKLAAVFLVADKMSKHMAMSIIITQIILIGLEIATVVLWVGMNNIVRAIDIIFMIVSVISIILAIACIATDRCNCKTNRYDYNS